ncbi:MAG: hypothetical protein A2538_02100 [Candidatus Magasanikbacteria bacterium RIFOXYD2_FULL_41_14]|uniref:Glycerol-3-phosphate dehydrogenase n=1 Tax=Candidatus Magasanikbacteria bacterium RIFOXYD2_FULL_41_14 TaxID=1798709 RepID=A0A1F6PD36_9BACT|nr:MAG: hypothetical protein A2538_02100 [Candidatus Magasanikbacteria bacterium RIFOXYD2_FULL_41_14]
MGTALAQVIAKNGHKVTLWNVEIDPEPLEQIARFKENKKYLPGIKLSKNIKPEPDLKRALNGAQVLVLAIPSKYILTILKRARPYLKGKIICLNASKGFTDNLETISVTAKKLLPKLSQTSLGSLSGPAIATDLALGKFTAMDIASSNKHTIKVAREILGKNKLKLNASSDLIGVETAGAIKNVYAIALGIAVALDYSHNTISALMVAALKEMSVLIKAAGGQSNTVLGLSGVGDLIGTGLCPTSRNHRFGNCLAHGLCTADALLQVKQIVEGVPATSTIERLGKKYQIKLPLAHLVALCVKGAKTKIEFEKYLSKYSQ